MIRSNKMIKPADQNIKTGCKPNNLAQEFRIKEPCPMNWEDMNGDDKKRFCSQCSLHVHNLSAMNDGEIDRLRKKSGGLCVGYYQDPENHNSILKLPSKENDVQRNLPYVSQLKRIVLSIVASIFPFVLASCNAEEKNKNYIVGKMAVAVSTNSLNNPIKLGEAVASLSNVTATNSNHSTPPKEGGKGQVVNPNQIPPPQVEPRSNTNAVMIRGLVAPERTPREMIKGDFYMPAQKEQNSEARNH